MPRSPRPRTDLSDSLHRQLNVYALVAGATGVGLLAHSQPTNAKVVYTPIHKTIKLHQHYNLDLNRDGVTDFTLQLTSFHTRNTSAFSTLRIVPKKVNAAGGGTHGTSCGGGRGAGPYAFALQHGAVIGPKGRFHGKANLMAVAGTIDGFSVYCGPWLGAQNRYLGLKFAIRGGTHFGWARLSVVSTDNGVTSATLTGYAYETIPGKAIIAGATKGQDDDAQTSPVSINTPIPAPATLGTLALGAPGLSIWKREESLATWRPSVEKAI